MPETHMQVDIFMSIGEVDVDDINRQQESITLTAAYHEELSELDCHSIYLLTC